MRSLSNTLADLEKCQRRIESLERDLLATREASQKALQAKADFLSNMNHELRTPLSSVIGMSEVLWETDLSPEQRKVLSSLITGGRTLLAQLKDIDESGLAADFYIVLLNTGMRLGEGLSISLADFFPGVPDNKVIRGALDRHDLKSFGYISLESQLANAIKPRKESGVVARKPLKGRKRVDARASRVIPILDKETFNILARRFNEQTELIADGKFGNAKSDYLLFDGLDKNRFSRLLREAYTGVRFSHKSPHCARHTFATKFAGLTNADTGLCRLVLGHRDEDTTLGYVHLFEQINRQARAKELVKMKIDLIE